MEEQYSKRIKSQKKLEKNGYFSEHECGILDDQSKHLMMYSKFRKFIMYLTTARCGDIRARRMCRSYAAYIAEIQRHTAYYPFSIHPFSRLRLGIEIFSIFTLLLCFVVNTIHVITGNSDEVIVLMLKGTEALFLINVISNFFTGYIDGVTTQHVVLNLRKIIWRYVRSWLVVDLLFCSCVLTNHVQKENFDWNDIVQLVKILKIPALFTYTFNLLEVIGAGAVTKTTVEITFLLLNYLLWNIFFQFYVEYDLEDAFVPEHPRDCSWMTITGIWNATSTVKLVFATHRAVNMLRQNSNLQLLTEGGCFEIFFLIAWIIAKLLVFHCILKYMLLLFGLESSRAKYFMMSQQVQNYMDQRKFPSRLKKKILKFYAVRFQSHFFVESRMMDCVSGQLREDLIMYSGRQLVNQVEFLKHLPRSLLLQIGTKLKLVIFLAGDIIFKINTVGPCLYFIDKGTVAIYSESGKEVCHLEDGNFFGEIALVIKPGFRTESAVAVTNCELFRLDKKDFYSTIACYPTVYEDIKKVASQRLERTTVMDEHHKAELRMGKDQKDE